MNASLTSQPKESQVKNTTLLEIIKTIGGSASPTYSAYKAVRKAKNHATWLEFCDLNGYCFSWFHEVIGGHYLINESCAVIFVRPSKIKPF